MIVFAISLRGRKTTNDWEGVLKRFNQTLESIFNQTNSNFKVIVATNEKIKTRYDQDERLEFIYCDIPIPKSWIEMARDKFYKLTCIAYRIRQILLESKNPDNGIYVMPVDADDLISNRIAAFFNQKNLDGDVYVSKYGYVYYQNKHFLLKYPKLYEFCGSCNIIRMYLKDLPIDFPNANLCHDKNEAKVLNELYPIRYDHNKIVNIYKSSNKKICFLSFPSTIYMKGTGENISEIDKSVEKVIDNGKIHLGVLVKK